MMGIATFMCLWKCVVATLPFPKFRFFLVPQVRKVFDMARQTEAGVRRSGSWVGGGGRKGSRGVRASGVQLSSAVQSRLREVAGSMALFGVECVATL
jgi:hypothetical protein